MSEKVVYGFYSLRDELRFVRKFFTKNDFKPLMGQYNISDQSSTKVYIDTKYRQEAIYFGCLFRNGELVAYI